MRSGVLYQPGGRRSGELNVGSLVRRLKAVAWSMRNLGLAMMLGACVGLGYILGPMAAEEVKYALRPPQALQPVSKLSSAVKDLPNWQVPDMNYSLYIPKIGAKSAVVGDVDAGDENAYLEALKRGVAEARGLAHPGQIGTTYLFAHSTDSPVNYARYNAVFFLLHKLEEGDDIEVVYRGNLHRYKVAAKEVTSAEDVTRLVPQNREELLVLQTCYPPGTTWKRLVVTAKRS